MEFLAHEIELADEDLMNILIQFLENGLFKITKGIAMHHQHNLCVAFGGSKPSHERLGCPCHQIRETL